MNVSVDSICLLECSQTEPNKLQQTSLQLLPSALVLLCLEWRPAALCFYTPLFLTRCAYVKQIPAQPTCQMGNGLCFLRKNFTLASCTFSLQSPSDKLEDTDWLLAFCPNTNCTPGVMQKTVYIFDQIPGADEPNEMFLQKTNVKVMKL